MAGRPRDRRSGMGLLPRMEARPWKDGKTVTYRYKPLEGKPINLGTDRVMACRKVLDMTGRRDIHGTMQWLWEQYSSDDPKAPNPRWRKLSENSKDDYRGAWKQIAKTFGRMLAANITSKMVAQYVHVERASAPRRADIEKALLSNLFGHGVKLGVCEINPTISVQPHGSEPRTEAPDPAVLLRFLDWISRQTPQRRIIGMAAEYASLAGSRRVEFLDLAWPQVDRVAGVVRTKRAKQRGAKRGEIVEQVEITPALGALLDRLEALRRERNVDCLYVFPTRDNNAYTSRGFQTLWQRCVVLAMTEGVISPEARFTFHDLRAYYATLHKRERGELPDLHANKETTARVYDRNKVVKRRAL